MNGLTDKCAAKCGKTTLVSSDWLVRCEGGAGSVNYEVTQQLRSNFPKEQVMKKFFQFAKKQEVALTVALVWMVVWAGFAMTEAFSHIA